MWHPTQYTYRLIKTGPPDTQTWFLNKQYLSGSFQCFKEATLSPKTLYFRKNNVYKCISECTECHMKSLKTCHKFTKHHLEWLQNMRLCKFTLSKIYGLYIPSQHFNSLLQVILFCWHAVECLLVSQFETMTYILLLSITTLNLFFLRNKCF